jgi:hypothetical protein
MSATDLNSYRITLDVLADSPQRALDLPPGEAMSLLARAATVQAALMARVVTVNSNPTQSTAAEADDRMLSVIEIAAVLKRPAAWIVRNRRKLPFIHQVSPKTFVASERAIRRWLNSRRG